MKIKTDNSTNIKSCHPYEAGLLTVLSKYFEPDKTNLSFQTICDDIYFLSQASVCVLNMVNQKTGALICKSVSHSNFNPSGITKLRNREWMEGSLIYKTLEDFEIREMPEINALEAFEMTGINLFSRTLRSKGINLGSVLFGFTCEKQFETKQSVEYFIQQLEKIIPSLPENKIKDEDLFKHSEIIKKNDTDFVFIIDPSFIIIDTNTDILTKEKLTGRSKTILDLIPDNIKNSFTHTINTCFTTAKLGHEEIPLCIDGKQDTFYAIKFIPILKNNTVESICMIASDTEEQKHILKDFNTLQNFAKLGWWELHLPSNKLLWSEGLYRLLELDPLNTESSDELYVKYIYPDDLDYVENSYKKALRDEKGEYEINYRLLMKDGRIKWVTDKCITYFDDNGNQFRSLGIIQDITQLKDTEIKLEKINSSYKRLNNQVPGELFEYQIFENGERRYNSASERTTKRLGVEAEKLRNNGEHVWNYIHPEDLPFMKSAFAESAKTLKKINLEYRIKVADEKNRVQWKRLEAQPEIQDDHSRIWYGYISDIDDIKKAQHKIVEAKEEAERANKAKTEFLANMSHEIRTPLNAVLGFSELLKGNTKGPKYETYIDGILSGGKNLLSLIDDILDLSKIEAGQMIIERIPVSLEKLANEFRQMFAQKALEKGIDYNIYFENDLPKYVLIDETRIRQILFNLVGNAFKFTHHGSVRLSMVAKSTPSSQSKISLVFKVSDTGIGIPENQHKLIFESFKQQDGQSNRKYGGTGLGLAITKRLVDMMNGSICLESTIGKGSSFSVVINEIDVACLEEDQEQDNTLSDYLFEGQKILLVEDVSSNREIIKGFLEPLNLKVVIAENGQEALNRLKSELPDLILMDMMMPVMDGYTAVKIIRGQSCYDKIPVIALTASALKQSELEIRELCNDYLRKPVSKKDLTMVLSRYLSNSTIKTDKFISLHGTQTNISLPYFKEEYKQELRSLFLSRWQDVSKLMSIDDIVNFAVQLNSYAVQIKSNELETYCKHLLNHAENFDIEKMNTFFYAFKPLIKEDTLINTND